MEPRRARLRASSAGAQRPSFSPIGAGPASRSVTGLSQTSTRISASCAGPVKRSSNRPGSCSVGTGGMNRAQAERHSGVRGNCSHHRQRQIHTPAKEAHRHRGQTPTAQRTAKAQARRIVGPNLARAAPGLAWIVGAVQRTTASTSIGARKRRQLMIDAQQQREELRVLHEGMAPWNGLFSWSKRDSPSETNGTTLWKDAFPINDIAWC